jgi:site-specific DNA-methyltransferase (adenine-specific)
MSKAFEAARAGATVVTLVPVRADAAWWHNHVLATGAEVRYVRGRLTFGDAVNTAAFSSAVVVYRPTDEVGSPGPVRAMPAHPSACAQPRCTNQTGAAKPSVTDLHFSTGDVLVGDALSRLTELPDNYVDSVVCDPPYGLTELSPELVTSAVTAWFTGDTAAMPKGRGFMGKSWDAFVPPPALWAECLRILKPGGHLAAFAGSRTVDLMGLSIRLAGFEVRDTFAWLYGTGFPRAGLLKPAHEPILLARKPFSGSRKANVAKYGTGALNIDACIVGSQPRDAGGRWPANLLLTHSAKCQRACENRDCHETGTNPALLRPDRRCSEVHCSAGCPVAELTQQSCTSTSDGAAQYFTQAAWSPDLDGDVGFLYCAKPDKKERDAGLGHLCEQPVIQYQTGNGYSGRASSISAGRKTKRANIHPTVKPVAVMAWLINLLTPPGGVTCDPFIGSSSSAVAAIREGFRFVGCEMEEDYLPIIEGRIRHAEATCIGAESAKGCGN